MGVNPEAGGRPDLTRRSALHFVLLLGAVSLFADMTYEGARSSTGPFLALLGASGTAVGVFAGLGELLGYGLRLVSGWLTDRTRRYWAVAIAGYTVNLLAVPALALAGSWQAAIALMMLERTGKAIRKPARDAMLSHATQHLGAGWTFGLHEALDQTGALLGPLILIFVLATGRGYRVGFGLLLVPAVITLALLLTARRQYPRPADLEVPLPDLRRQPQTRTFWLYTAAAALVAAGYADFSLIAYRLAKGHVLAAPWVPALYALAMGISALSALAVGRWLDRAGLTALIVGTLITAAFAPLVFLGGAALAVLGMAVWGFGMGLQDAVVRAVVAGMVPAERRASAYGLFDTGYGVAWFAGSALMGILYDHSVGALVAFSVLAQIAAIPLLLIVRRRTAPRERRDSAAALKG